MNKCELKWEKQDDGYWNANYCGYGIRGEITYDFTDKKYRVCLYGFDCEQFAHRTFSVVHHENSVCQDTTWLACQSWANRVILDNYDESEIIYGEYQPLHTSWSWSDKEDREEWLPCDWKETPNPIYFSGLRGGRNE